MEKSKHPKTYDVEFLEIILEDVSRETKIPLEQLKDSNRKNCKKEEARAKQLYVALAREYVKTDWGTIGSFINKTHSTVIHTIKKFEDSHFTDFGFRKMWKKMVDILDFKRSLQREGLYRCGLCNGPNVQSLAMLDLNSGKLKEMNSKFCTDCNCETTIKKIDIAGWSSWPARGAHNPEVEGSNPSPATTKLELYEN